MPTMRMKRREDSLAGQVVAANVLLVTLTIFAASLAAGLNLTVHDQRWQFLVLAMALVLTLAVNLWMLQRRFAPLDRLIDRIEQVDPSAPSSFRPEAANAKEVERLERSFRGLLDRVEVERRRGGQLVLRAQEEERRRVARDLHDEVNQALTAILLRLEALAQDAPPGRADEVVELKRLANSAMDELLNLARQLRPAALDDHGLVAAIDAQLKQFSARTGIAAALSTTGDPSALDEDLQTAVYRVTQETLANAARHAGASRVQVELAAQGAGAELHVRDDGQGFDLAAPPSETRGAGLGLEGMAERARLVGGALDVRSSPGGGTSVTLRVPG
jgi:two-component system sensor histidine kinase UhpB